MWIDMSGRWGGCSYVYGVEIEPVVLRWWCGKGRRRDRLEIVELKISDEGHG